MKVLFLTPHKGESLKNIVPPPFDGTVTADTIDLRQHDLDAMPFSAVRTLIEKHRDRITAADIIHSFSGIALILRPLFPATLIVTLPGTEAVASFLPHPGEPGIELLPAAECRDAATLTAHYRRILNNKKRRDERPWGSWESLRLMDDHKVKHIYVAPGQKLSLQLHHRRSEVWTVVAGSGTITVGDQALPAAPGQVFIIGKEQVHRAEGGPAGLHFIEVQAGDYLGEDDIVRLEDSYGRT
ncbi:MAG TPA: phosphomannose isomerase type II C-terminal cupin domain [bacterium]|nr:phosphomannose isomerase type II C-terminal cupin domain [bacterium]